MSDPDKEELKLATVEVSITDTDVFDGVLDLVQEILTDDRIGEEVREDYLDELQEII